MVQYLDKFMDMCVVKVMPGEEKSQRRAVEHSGNKLKEVLTILSVSIANTNPAASQRPSAELGVGQTVRLLDLRALRGVIGAGTGAAFCSTSWETLRSSMYVAQLSWYVLAR